MGSEVKKDNIVKAISTVSTAANSTPRNAELPALLRLSEDLITLQRGSDELLLADAMERRPLYIKQGGRYIKTFLRAAADLGTPTKLLGAYPKERRLLGILLDYGILVGDGQARQVQKSRVPGPAPAPGKKLTMSLYLLLSQSCNMRCAYCLDGQRTYQSDKGLRMSREVAFKSVEHCLGEIAEGGRLEIIFFGGEPLLNWPLAKEVITHCERSLAANHVGKNKRYHVTSNLSILPPDLLEWAKKYDISFLCDIDGPPAIHNACRPFKDGCGTYESVTRHIRLIREAGLKIDLRATVTSLNENHLVETTEHHKKIGGQSSAFIPVNPVNSDESILPQSLLPSPEKVIKGMASVFRSKIWPEAQLYPFNLYAGRFTAGGLTTLGCGAPSGNILVVDVAGNAYPCIYLVGIKRFHLGNIMDGSYPRTDVLVRMHDGLHVDGREGCKHCSWRYVCGGGCPVGAITVSENPMAGSEVKAYCRQMCCDYTKNILELLLWERAEAAASFCAESEASIPKVCK